MKAELIIIGNEILNGTTLDTNSKFIATELEAINVKVMRRTTIPDEKNAIKEAIELAASRSDLIVTTGGLGPTKDDITKHTICQLIGDELVLNTEVLAHVEAFFAKRGKVMLDVNKLQAMVPSTATVLFNDTGTAPGMFMPYKKSFIVSMPGVPHEMKYIVTKRLIPLLKKENSKYQIHHRFILTVGMGESYIAQAIESIENNLPEYISLAYLPNIGMVKLRLTAFLDHDYEEGQKQLDAIEAKIKNTLGDIVYGSNGDTLSSTVGQLLLAKNKTVGTAESCSSGYLSNLITQTPGSSLYYMGSVVAYSYALKEKLLHVQKQTLENYGAVSEQAIIEMAKGGLKQLETDYIIATSGIAGPGGGMPDKPVGTVWIAVGNKDEIIAKKYVFGNDRARNTHLTSIVGLDMLRKFLSNMSL